MPDGCVLKIHLKPNADNDGIVEIRRDFLKIKVNALPEKGKANERLIKFLARVLSISRESVFIIRQSLYRLPSIIFCLAVVFNRVLN